MNKIIKSWSDELETGVLWQDYQHRELLAKMLYLNKNISEDGGEDLGNIITFLAQYTHNHFGIEEQYMQTFSYPESRAHKRAHGHFVAMIDDIKKIAKKILASGTLLFDLNNWFISHISTSDKRLAQYIKNTIKI